MVCNRCIMVVNNIFHEFGYSPVTVILGEVEIKEEINLEKLKVLDQKLRSLGFEIIDDSKGLLIEKIKNLVIKLVHYGQDNEHKNYSAIIESNLNRDYNYLQ